MELSSQDIVVLTKRWRGPCAKAEDKTARWKLIVFYHMALFLEKTITVGNCLLGTSGSARVQLISSP